MPAEPERPGPVEATALAVAGPAFALSLLFLRGTTDLDARVFDGGAAVLVAAGLASWAHRLWGAAWGTILRGAGLGIGVLLVAPSLVPPFFSGVLPVLVAIAGGTLLQANARRARPTVSQDSAGVVLIGVAFALALLVSGDFTEPGRLRLALVVVVGVAIAGLALRRAAVEKGYAALAPMPLGILLVSALGGVYLSYRTLVREHVANLPLYEWTLAALASSLLLARLRRRAKERETSEAWTAAARRHAQDVRPIYDARMGPVAAAVARYLERGEGFQPYREAMLHAAGPRPPAALVAALDEAPKGATGRSRAAKKAARSSRLAAHELILGSIERGPPHGEPQPRVR